MWEEVMGVAISNGLWAVLSCVLLFYLLNDSRKREKKYVDIIRNLSDKLDIVEEIKINTDKIVEKSTQKTRATKKMQTKVDSNIKATPHAC